VPNELLAELASEVEEAQTAHDEGVKEVEEKESEATPVEVEPEKEPEQQAEPVEEEKEEKETPRVPLPELQAERKKRQAAEAERDADREKFARLDERLKIINDQMKPKEEIPAYEDDPFEHLRQREDQTGQTVEDLQKQVEDFGKQTEAQRFQQELTQRVVSSEHVFRQDHPDYDEAVQYLRSGRAREFQAMGMTDQVQIEQALSQEAMQLAQMAVKNGASTAEMAYNIAKSRGYSPKAQLDKLANVQKGQEKSASLSNTGGGEERILDIEALAEMDDADFAKAVEGNNWDKMMKGT
jgi:colicin import membrane protein